MTHPIRGTRRERSLVHMHALLELSGRNGEDFTRMLDIVSSAPDCATAIHEVMHFLNVDNGALQEKWSKHVTQVWFELHPNVPSSLNLHIMSQDIMLSDAIMEAHGVLQALLEQPAKASVDFMLGMLDREEEKRLAREITLFAGDDMLVRRVCDVLEELRLIRVVKGEVRVIKSRYNRFQALPLSGQYYLLWHIDMYHLDWKEYTHQMQSHLAIFQQYVPMIWELLEHTSIGQTHSVDEFAWHIVRAFRPLWQQERALGIVEQSAVHGMVSDWLVDKVFIRYGLVDQMNLSENGSPKSFIWNRAGMALLHSERTIKLPCAIDVLE
jgi:hypothetical protein